MVYVEIKPELFRWACERSGLTMEQLQQRFPRLAEWQTGQAKPTLKQLEDFAKATLTPVGYLFLPEPPTDEIPIPDMRTVGSKPLSRPSAALLDTIQVCQRRQAWYHDYLRSLGEEALRFVGSATVSDEVEAVAETIRDALEFDLEARRACKTWDEALRQLRSQAEALGVLVMCNGVVGNNTHRALDSEEFRGFALVDDLAPLVFVNAADTKAAQMFTLAHEIAHVWLGQSALSNAEVADTPRHGAERWCNRVAAEVLAPLRQVRTELRRSTPPMEEARRLARVYKVSTLVSLCRMRDAEVLDRGDFSALYGTELARLKALKATSRGGGGGGDFYLNQLVRASPTFQRALFVSTLEGETLFRDALQLMSISKMETFQELGRRLGYAG